MRVLRHGIALVTALGLGACGDAVTFDDDADAQSGTDSVESTSTTQALLSMTADVTAGSVGEQMAATNAAQNSGSFFQPAGCVVTQRAGATVAYTFTNCTGPYGLVNLNGAMRRSSRR